MTATAHAGDRSEPRRTTASIDCIRPVLRGAGNIALVIEGPPGSGRLTAAACALGGELVALDLARLAPTQLEDGLRALRREQLLRSQVPALANVDRVLGEDAHECRRLIGALIDHIDGPLIITAVTTGPDLGTERPLVRIRWSPPSTEVRAALWMRAVQTAGAAPDSDLWELAHRYRVGPAAIARAVTSARLAHTPGRALDETALSTGLRHNIAEQLGGLAQRIEVTQCWDDLVIADDIADMIAALVGRVRHAHQVLDRWGYRKKIARGAGVAALFSGPPGTGKTMVAGLIARELDLELYQVDLSKVVSKWVGETEKNLSRIFDAAEQGHALLLFEKAQQAFEHDCQFGGACEVAISGYLDFHTPEPVPHRGLDLANWACQHGGFCRPEVAPAQEGRRSRRNSAALSRSSSMLDS